MEFTNTHKIWIEKGYIEIDKEKDRVIYKNLKGWDKKHRLSDPEEQVRLEWFIDLVTKYQYEPKDIDLEVEMPKRVPNQFADLVIYNEWVDSKYFVIEFKKANITDNEFEQAVKQGIWNGRILKSKYYGTISWETVRFFEEWKDDSLDDAFYSIPIKYWKPEEWTFIKGWIVDLEPVTSESLETVLGKAHQTIWDWWRRDKSRAFWEVAKIIFIKMWDENKARKVWVAYEFQRKRNESVEKLALRIHAIYDEAKQRDKHVFAENIKLDDKELTVVVEHLQRLSLTKTDLDVKGEAFQKFLWSFFKGDFWSYFTPSFVSKFCIDIFWEDIQNYDKVLDPACWSGWFLLKTLDLIRSKADEYYEKNSSEHYKYWHDFAVNNLFGIEISEDTARIAKMNMILNEDWHTNVIWHDALDKIEKMQTLNLWFKKEWFDYIFTNPPFWADIKSILKDYLWDYELAKKGNKLKASQKTEILFIERCWQFLKSEWKMVIVLPDWVLTNSSLKDIREWILEHFKILWVISLPQDAFRYYWAWVKSSILIMQKWWITKECDYKIFMATAEKIWINATWRKCENELPNIANQFREFLKNPTNF